MLDTHTLPRRGGVPALATLQILFLAAFAAGCAGTPQPTPESTDGQDRTYHILMAEIALQRGENATGVEEYLKAARAGESVETASQATRTAFDYGYDRVAYEAARRWVELAPQDAEARRCAGRLALQHQQVEEAARHLQEAAAADGADDAAFRELVTVLMEEGHPEDAFAVAERLADAYEDNAYAQATAASAALRADDAETAIAYARRARGLAPEEPRATLLLARALEADEQTEAALETAAPLADAEDLDLRLDYALFLAGADRPDEARTVVNRMLQDEPGQADAWRATALISLQQGDYEAAWTDFSEVLKSGEHTHEALFYLATIAEEREDWLQAMRLYAQVGKGGLQLAAQQRVSVILTRLGQADGALSQLERFARRNPRQALDVRFTEAQLLEAMERYEEALDAYDEILAAKPPSLGLLLSRAEVELARGETDAAVEGYREALALRPESATALNALGYTLADRTDRLKEARKLIERALEKEPENAAIIDSMGWVLFRQGEPEAALPYLERAWDMIRDPEVAAHLGETLWVLGRRAEAREILQEAYDEFPGSEPLRDTLQRLMEASESTES
ncbi:tetratricopeptide repeat protein [Lentisalinibacter sediminis]|uniref:tetratricopeptide repeat protein n=1 Tax=Lentisalinibacter sediminis TaxID=2992237 RepID=UPI00386EBC82